MSNLCLCMIHYFIHADVTHFSSQHPSDLPPGFQDVVTSTVQSP